MNGKTFAVILSGSGHLDGSEIHEATLTLWAIHKHGYEYHCFAPDTAQHHVVNHLTGKESEGQRNILEESARIARGKISPLTALKPEDYDALVIPGGFGAAKNLSNYALNQNNCSLHQEVKKAIEGFHSAQKPIGALCIAPILLASTLPGSLITLGEEGEASKHAEQLGAQTKVTNHGEVIVDKSNKLVTTPCYMLDARVDQIADGTDALITAISDFFF